MLTIYKCQQMNKCTHKGCEYRHEEQEQVLLHEATTYHCPSCQRSGPELTNINIHRLCDSCTVVLEWEAPDQEGSNA